MNIIDILLSTAFTSPVYHEQASKHSVRLSRLIPCECANLELTLINDLFLYLRVLRHDAETGPKKTNNARPCATPSKDTLPNMHLGTNVKHSSI